MRMCIIFKAHISIIFINDNLNDTPQYMRFSQLGGHMASITIGSP